MKTLNSSLPVNPLPEVKKGGKLFGDDLDEKGLRLWYEQEKEAYYSSNSDSGSDDPWYAYMRYLNERLGFSVVKPNNARVLFLGPGAGEEVEAFERKHPGAQLVLIEASDGFKKELARKFPASTIVSPSYDGRINLEDGSVDIACAFSVLHHIPNVSFVIAELSRVLKKGGVLFIREPCSSMGQWGRLRSATPNERGMSRQYVTDTVTRCGLSFRSSPMPILYEPINIIIKKLGLTPRGCWGLLFIVDRLVSLCLMFNDRYWRDRFLHKLAPSSYFYVCEKR